jgi:hypothetical protein
LAGPGDVEQRRRQGCVHAINEQADLGMGEKHSIVFCPFNRGEEDAAAEIAWDVLE